MRFATIYLRIMGGFSVLFGLVYLIAPGGMTDAAGFGALAPGGVTDVRATYGGFQLGLGFFLLWAAAERSRVSMALVLVALSIGAVGSSRAIGLVLDGEPNPFHVMGLVTEVSLTALTLFALGKLRSDPGAAPA